MLNQIIRSQTKRKEEVKTTSNIFSNLEGIYYKMKKMKSVVLVALGVRFRCIINMRQVSYRSHPAS